MDVDHYTAAQVKDRRGCKIKTNCSQDHKIGDAVMDKLKTIFFTFIKHKTTVLLTEMINFYCIQFNDILNVLIPGFNYRPF